MIKFGTKRFLFWLLLVLVGPSTVWALPIEVRVEITEVNHAKAMDLGVEWLNSIRVGESEPAGLISLGSIQRFTPVRADVRFLVEEGAAEILAEPNLVTDSGTPASFRAGGEIPYITSTSLGSTHVEFKPYGVSLNITPRLVESSDIRLEIKASVSSPDQVNGVLLSGNRVPALFERVVTSNVTVSPETTITLAGLIQNHQEKSEKGIPLLRRIPLLGRLFRWTSKRVRRTSVIIFVTPRIAKV